MSQKFSQNGRKYISLTNSILLEYTYVLDRYDGNDDIDDDVIESGLDGFTGTYGRSSDTPAMNSNGYVIAESGYRNEIYFMNVYGSESSTKNTMLNSVMPMRKDLTQWVATKPDADGDYFVRYDRKWCTNMNNSDAEGSLTVLPERNEYIPYDVVRIYFQSGYHPEYDGFVINFFTKNRSSERVNLLSVLNRNSDDRIMVTEPMWYADKIYTEYIEYRIPSVAYLSSECMGGMPESMSNPNANGWTAYDRSDPKTAPGEHTLSSYITSGKGFYSSPAIGVELHAVVGFDEVHGFKVYKTRAITSTLFPNRDSYDNLIALVKPSDNGSYFTAYGYYENDISNPVYSEVSLSDYLKRFKCTFSITHIISVTENFTDTATNETITYQHPPVTYIQTWDMIEGNQNGESPVIRFRPVLEHTSDLSSASITYTLRIVSNLDNTSIIKTSSCEIINPRRFGLDGSSISAGTISNIHVYNRITGSPDINIAETTYPIGAPSSGGGQSVVVNKYVTSSFIDRRNIRVSVSPVRIDNVE